jgi:hypothetical protein
MYLDENVPQHAEFILQCPVLASIVKANDGYWPPDCQELLKQIVEVCKAPFIVQPCDQEKAAAPTGLEFWQEGHWYPHWERLRKGKHYSKYYTAVPEPINGLLYSNTAINKYKHKFIILNIGQTRWQKYFAHATQNHRNDGNCHKKEQGSGSMHCMVPVCIVCCEHGVVYGYHMMVDPEGRKDLFYVLYERFPQPVLDDLTVVSITSIHCTR